jgi:hypothetical protein
MENLCAIYALVWTLLCNSATTGCSCDPGRTRFLIQWRNESVARLALLNLIGIILSFSKDHRAAADGVDEAGWLNEIPGPFHDSYP